jgi:hypothetical protein
VYHFLLLCTVNIFILRGGIVSITGVDQYPTWTVFDTLGLSTTQVTGDRHLLAQGNGDGSIRAGGKTFPAPDAAFLIYLVYSFIFPADSLCRTDAYAGWISTVSAGTGKINQGGFIGRYFDAGKGGVENGIVGKGTDQLADPASGALGREITFLKNHSFESHVVLRYCFSMG